MKHCSLVAALAISLAGCQLLSDGDDAAHDWMIADPIDLQYEPAEPVTFDIQGVDVDWSELRIWLDGEPWQIHGVGVVGKGDPSTTADDRIRVSDFLMTALPGHHTLAVGDTTGPRTRAFAIEVVVPAPRMSHAAMAALLRDGTRAMVDDVTAILEDTDPAVATLLDRAMTAEYRVHALAVLADIRPVADDMAEHYLALSPDDAAVVQAVWHNVGLVEAYRTMMGDVTARMAGEVLTPFDRLKHPAARALFYLDLTAAGLGSLSDAISIVNLLSALGGPGAVAWAPVGIGGKIVVGVIRVVLDSMVPTDLVALEPQTQAELYPNEGAKWIYWGTFQPQNGALNTAQSIVDQVIALVIPSIVDIPAPESVKRKAGELGARVFNEMLTRALGRAPGVAGRFAMPVDASRFSKVKLVVNMSAYNFTLADLMQLNPIFSAAAGVVRNFLDIELVSPYTLTAQQSWARDARIEIEYGEDRLGIDNIVYPTGVTQAQFRVDASTYRWRNKNILILSLPWIAFNEDASVQTTVVAKPQGQNTHVAYESYIVTHGTPGATSEDAVWRGESTNRAVEMRLMDMLSLDYKDTATMEIRVNGEPVFGGPFALADGVATYPRVPMRPGKNVVTFRALQGHHEPDGIVIPPEYPFHLYLIVTEAINHEKRRSIHLREGQTFEFVVFVPPAFAP